MANQDVVVKTICSELCYNLGFDTYQVTAIVDNVSFIDVNGLVRIKLEFNPDIECVDFHGKPRFPKVATPTPLDNRMITAQQIINYLDAYFEDLGAMRYVAGEQEGAYLSLPRAMSVVIEGIGTIFLTSN